MVLILFCVLPLFFINGVMSSFLLTGEFYEKQIDVRIKLALLSPFEKS